MTEEEKKVLEQESLASNRRYEELRAPYGKYTFMLSVGGGKFVGALAYSNDDLIGLGTYDPETNEVVPFEDTHLLWPAYFLSREMAEDVAHEYAREFRCPVPEVVRIAKFPTVPKEYFEYDYNITGFRSAANLIIALRIRRDMDVKGVSSPA